MDNQNSFTDLNPPNEATQSLDIDEEAEKLKTDIITNASNYAMKGKKTHKDIADTSSPEEYDTWDNEGSYEANTWTVAFSRFSNNMWRIQITRVELKPDGHSQMTAYSIRQNEDTTFPGFQIYREMVDNKYHPMQVEDIVYLNRVMGGLLGV